MGSFESCPLFPDTAPPVFTSFLHWKVSSVANGSNLMQKYRRPLKIDSQNREERSKGWEQKKLVYGLNKGVDTKASYTLFVFRILRMFLQNVPRNTKHLLYAFRISCKFCVLLMPRKNKLQNPLTFRMNANPDAKSKKRARNTPLYTFHFSHFAIVFAFHDECIAGLMELMLKNSVYTTDYT